MQVDQVHEEDDLFAPQEEEEAARQEKVCQGFPSLLFLGFLFNLDDFLSNIESEHESNYESDVQDGLITKEENQYINETVAC